ncbi:MAG: hypothetical protein ACREPE_01390 [Lysobacter sp.]
MKRATNESKWNTRRATTRSYPAALVALVLLVGCATPSSRITRADKEFGVLVMAHGGSAEWNRNVTAALAPIGDDYPIEIAFGMADAVSLQAGVDALEAQGVNRIGVVRLFVSGESWYERTEQILGLKLGAPAKPAVDDHADHGAHAGHSMTFWRLDTDAAFAISKQGLADAPEMGAVLAERARGLSQDPAREDVLILAHGPGDDAENHRWIEQIDARADTVRQALPFRRVQVETLREDWPDKRKLAEVRIRAFVARANQENGRAIVIPFRVEGFGPYAEVLKELEYVSDGRGLVPSPQIEQWVRRQAEELHRGGFRVAH